jgi:hypothetical protein
MRLIYPSLVRTQASITLSDVTVVAQDLKILRKIVGDDPVVHGGMSTLYLSSVLVPPAVDVVEG